MIITIVIIIMVIIIILIIITVIIIIYITILTIIITMVIIIMIQEKISTPSSGTKTSRNSTGHPKTAIMMLMRKTKVMMMINDH